jgi:asparagine synthase (glutamine-hydrolysing)
MCGIAGILNLNEPRPIDEELLLKMLGVIRYRGPDESGIYMDPCIGMGQVRLSIIGINGGTQPISNEDGSSWIVYNGEAFNYIELKEELVRKGHRFRTETDTEVILHLYDEYGPQCLEKINGQFALAIWDSRKNELFLARDRMGIRPLYYCRKGNEFLFASEIKSIFMDPGIDRVIDLEALNQVFTFWTTLTPKTIFKNIFEVPPGHYVTIKDGSINQKAFWRIPHVPHQERMKVTLEEAKEELHYRLKDAVRIRLRADVAVGAYASGGLDSSITTALIAKHFNNRLKTFSIGFQGEAFDESAYQRELVDYLGTDHHQTLASNSSICEHFADTVWHCEKPLLRTAPVPLFLLSKLVSENQYKVVLTGEGADEVFGGYNIYKEAKIREFWARQPESSLRPLLLQRLYPFIFKNSSRAQAFFKQIYSVKPGDLEDSFFSHRIRWQTSGKNALFFSDDATDTLKGYDPIRDIEAKLPEDFTSRDVFSRAQFLEMNVFLSNYLLSSQGDRVAMANSLEIRLPFLDYRVVEFASRLPAKWKMNGLNEKYILKKSSVGMIPDSIRNRVKQPYRAPIRGVFFQDGSSEVVDDMMSEDYLKKVGLFNAKKVGKLVERYRRKDGGIDNEVQNMALVGILSTQLVHHQFIENFPWKPVEAIKPDKIVRNF